MTTVLRTGSCSWGLGLGITALAEIELIGLPIIAGCIATPLIAVN